MTTAFDQDEPGGRPPGPAADRFPPDDPGYAAIPAVFPAVFEEAIGR